MRNLLGPSRLQAGGRGPVQREMPGPALAVSGCRLLPGQVSSHSSTWEAVGHGEGSCLKLDAEKASGCHETSPRCWLVASRGRQQRKRHLSFSPSNLMGRVWHNPRVPDRSC